MSLTLEIRNGKLVCPNQGEIENLAIEKIDTHYNIFFDPIPLTDKFDLMWSDEVTAWVIRYILQAE
jgi:hypothetical protein